MEFRQPPRETPDRVDTWFTSWQNAVALGLRAPSGPWRVGRRTTCSRGHDPVIDNAQRTRVKSVIQLVSHVLPSSGENACSQWHEVAVMSDQR